MLQHDSISDLPRQSAAYFLYRMSCCSMPSFVGYGNVDMLLRAELTKVFHIRFRNHHCDM